MTTAWCAVSWKKLIFVSSSFSLSFYCMYSIRLLSAWKTESSYPILSRERGAKRRPALGCNKYEVHNELHIVDGFLHSQIQDPRKFPPEQSHVFLLRRFPCPQTTIPIQRFSFDSVERCYFRVNLAVIGATDSLSIVQGISHDEVRCHA